LTGSREPCKPLDDLVALVLHEFDGLVTVTYPEIPSGAGEAAIEFMPSKPMAATVFVIYSVGNYHIEVNDGSFSYDVDSADHVSDENSLFWASKQIFDIGSRGLVAIKRFVLFGIPYSTEVLVPEAINTNYDFGHFLGIRSRKRWLPW